MKYSLWANLGAGYLGLCIVLGGASAAGAIANGVLQLVAVGLILALFWSRGLSLPPAAKGLVWLVGLYLAFLILSLAPLPPELWQSLPFRSQIAQAMAMLGVEGAWMPLSLAPSATLNSILWLLPPSAVFLIAVRLAADQRVGLQLAVLVTAIFSMVLGAFQLLGGPGSLLRFYEIASPNAPIGFFANVNHQATLLLSALPLTAAIASRFARRRSRKSEMSGGMIMSIVTAIFLTIGIALTGSMAGYGLFALAAPASILIYRRAVVGLVSWAWVAGLAVLLIVFGVASAGGPLSEQRLSGEFSEHPTSRKVIAVTSIEAIERSFPVGTGLGTFADVYRRFENPQQASTTFVNHAHNDYLEFALEMGLPGIILAVAFLIWWAVLSLRAWRSDQEGANLARAASVVIGTVLLHSIVDYPLRTSAIAAVFAMACAFLCPTGAQSPSGSSRPEAAGTRLRHLEAE